MTFVTYILIAIPVCLLAIVLWTCYDYHKYKRKNHLIILLLILLYPVSAQAQCTDKEECNIAFKWFENQKGKLEYVQDDIIYSFIPENDAWQIRIKNVSGEDAVVNWDNAEFIINGKASGVNLYPFTPEEKDIAEEIVKSNSEIEQTITASNLVTEKKTDKIYYKKDLKKGGQVAVRIVLPIAIGNKPKFYHSFDFIVTKNN